MSTDPESLRKLGARMEADFYLRRAYSIEELRLITGAADEIQNLCQRIVSAEVALAMFVVKKPRIDPQKMVQAYTMAYPEPMASERSIEVCVAAKESGEHEGRGGRVS